MSAEIMRSYTMADERFEKAGEQALVGDDDQAWDEAMNARQHNDQAYFLYLFSRFESEVNAAVKKLLRHRSAPANPWADRRIWQAWSRSGVEDTTFLSKVEVLIDKSTQEYGTIKRYYDGRNTIAHGGTWQVTFYLPNVADEMDKIQQQFVTL